MTIEECIKKVPAWKNCTDIHYEPLKGGYTNSIWKVHADGDAWVLRINGNQNEFLGLDYKDEAEVISLAAAEGITPSILDCGETTDFHVIRFIEGRTLETDEMKQHDTIRTIVGLLKKVHALPYKGSRQSTQFSLLRRYLAGAEKLGISWADKLSPFLAEVDRIEKERMKDPEYLKHYCHNDVFEHNLMLGPDGRMSLLDWELSGIGDIWFDLATMSFCCGYDDAANEALIQSYFGACSDDQLKKLHDIRYVCMLREISWALLHTALNRLKPVPGNDFLEFAESVLNRLKQGITSLI